MSRQVCTSIDEMKQLLQEDPIHARRSLTISIATSKALLYVLEQLNATRCSSLEEELKTQARLDHEAVTLITDAILATKPDPAAMARDIARDMYDKLKGHLAKELRESYSLTDGFDTTVVKNGIKGLETLMATLEN